MARPRSILGLSYYLVSLYVRRRPVSYAAAAVAVVAMLGLVGGARSRQAPRAVTGELQTGVLRDGFVVAEAAGGGHRVVELDSKGGNSRSHTVRVADDLRTVGAPAGAIVGWQDGGQLRLARAADPSKSTTWGSAVRQLCAGAASNDLRYAIGWLESDDNVWIVHGRLAEKAAAGEPGDSEADDPAGEPGDPEAVSVATGAPRTLDWCGIASAEKNVAMLWRSEDRLSILMCTRSRCAGLVGTAALDRRLPILGFGCLRNACLIAARDAAGASRLAFVTSSGRVKWTQPLAASPSVAIVGLGDRAFAVGVATPDGAEVLRFTTSGAATSLWQDRGATGVPALAWSRGQLLIAHHHGDALVNEVIAAPR